MSRKNRFYGIIKKPIFESLTTPDKIKHCLQKDVFFYGNEWIDDNSDYSSSDFNKLDFKKYKKKEFNLMETYNLNYVYATWNPLFRREIIQKVKEVIGNTNLYHEIFNFLENSKIEMDEINYLKNYIRINQFDKLNYVVINRNEKNEIEIDDTETDSTMFYYAADFAMDWAFGEIENLEDKFPYYKYPKLVGFIQEYINVLEIIIIRKRIKELENLKKIRTSLIKPTETVLLDVKQKHSNNINYNKNTPNEDIIFITGREKYFIEILQEMGAIDNELKAQKSKFQPVCDAIYTLEKATNTPFLLGLNFLKKDYIKYLNKKYKANIKSDSKLSNGQNHENIIKNRIEKMQKLQSPE